MANLTTRKKVEEVSINLSVPEARIMRRALKELLSIYAAWPDNISSWMLMNEIPRGMDGLDIDG